MKEIKPKQIRFYQTESGKIPYNISKYGDLIFNKYWGYTYWIGFILVLNVILMIFLDNL